MYRWSFLVLVCVCAAVLFISQERTALSTQQTKSPIGRATVFNVREDLTVSPGTPSAFRSSPFSEKNEFYPGTAWPAADGVITDVVVALSRPLSGSEEVRLELIQNVVNQRIGPFTFGPGEDSTKRISSTTGWPFATANGWTISVTSSNLQSSVTVSFRIEWV